MDTPYGSPKLLLQRVGWSGTTARQVSDVSVQRLKGELHHCCMPCWSHMKDWRAELGIENRMSECELLTELCGVKVRLFYCSLLCKKVLARHYYSKGGLAKSADEKVKAKENRDILRPIIGVCSLLSND